MKKIIVTMLLLVVTGTLWARKSKLVGLARIANETYAQQYLQGLAQYTDALVVMVTNPQPKTLNMLATIKNELHIEAIFTQKFLENDLPTIKNMLLQAGREIEGTHFMMLEPYQIMSAQCRENNWLRTKIFTLNGGDSLQFPCLLLWRGLENYSAMDPVYSACAFADDGYCFYGMGHGYLCNVPLDTDGTRITCNEPEYGVVDFHAVTEEHQKSIYLWTQYEIRAITRIITPVPATYFKKLLQPKQLKRVDNNWLKYTFLDTQLYRSIDLDCMLGVRAAIGDRGTALFEDIGFMELSFPDPTPWICFWPQAKA